MTRRKSSKSLILDAPTLLTFMVVPPTESVCILSWKKLELQHFLTYIFFFFFWFVALGTEDYMPPEVIRNQLERLRCNRKETNGFQLDIWAIGK
jgi:serine/threonine protein kinase